MKLHQARFGYDAGHGQLASSIELTGPELALVEGLSDLSGYMDRGQSFEHYDMGYPCGRFYALTRTWPDRDNARPGTVFTHVLLLDPADLPSLDDPSALTAAFRFTPLPQRAAAVAMVDVSVFPVSPVPLSEAEGARLIAGWFGQSERPLVLREHPDRAIRWLWRRIPSWGRREVSWCTYCLRPRTLAGLPIDLQGVASGSGGRFSQHPELPTGEELGTLEQLLCDERAADLWRRAGDNGFAEVNPLLWLRFVEREAGADARYADALASFDLIGAVPHRPNQERLRTTVVDRLVGRISANGSLREVADLLVRDVDRALLGLRPRVELLLNSALSRVHEETDLSDLELVAAAAIRGGYQVALGEGLANAVRVNPAAWQIAWTHLPQVARELWRARSDDELASRFEHELTGPAREMVIGEVPQDTVLWRAFRDDEEAKARALAVLDDLAVNGEDWPAENDLFLDFDTLVACANKWDAPPAGLADAASRGLAMGDFDGPIPRWLGRRWLRLPTSRLRSLLERHTTLREVAKEQRETSVWHLLVDASPDDEVLEMTPPLAVRERWVRRALPIAGAQYADGLLSADTFLKVLGNNAWGNAIERTLNDMSARSPERVVDLLMQAGARGLRGNKNVLSPLLLKWGRSERRAPERVEALLVQVHEEAPTTWEHAAGALLIIILENPTTEVADLAAAVFRSTHQVIANARGQGGLLGLFRRISGREWSKASTLRRRYASAWSAGKWSTSNLVAAAGGDSQLLRALGWEVRFSREGERALHDRRGDVGEADWAMLMP